MVFDGDRRGNKVDYPSPGVVAAKRTMLMSRQHARCLRIIFEMSCRYAGVERSLARDDGRGMESEDTLSGQGSTHTYEKRYLTRSFV